MTSLRPRSSSVKIFLLSGVNDGVRKDLARKIHLLGGKYFDLQDFRAMCTHVVCGRLSLSEKFLGACATGKWVLHPDYVQDSYIAGCWLDEEQYEWCDDRISQKNKVDKDLAIAARRWRFLLGDASAAFTGWKVAVIAGAKRSKVIKRLLISGGAEVFNMRIPVRNPAKVADTIGYIFVSEQNMKSVIHLIDYGVLCIKPEFIGDFLIKYPQPDPMDYIVQVEAVGELPLNAIEPSSQNSFLMESQRSIYLSPQKLEQSQSSDFTPLLSVTSSPVSNNRPASKLIHDVKETLASSEQPGPSYLVDVKKETVEYYGEVIDLTDDTHENDSNIVNIESDDTEYRYKFACGKKAGERKIDVNKNGAELLDIKVKSENTDQVNLRKSKTNFGTKSPAWKSLIPGKQEEITDEDGKGTLRKTGVKTEENLTDSKCADNARNSLTGGRQGSAIKRNLIDSLKEDVKPTVTSTPHKTKITKKHLLQASIKLSPITKFFRRIAQSPEARTDSLKYSGLIDQTVPVSPEKAEINHLNKSDSVKKPTTSVICTDLCTDLKSKMENAAYEKKGNEQSISCLRENVIGQFKLKQNEEVRSKKSSRKQKLDGKGDRKRKPPGTEKVDAVDSGPSYIKRVTRSTPMKNEGNILNITPDKTPDINDFTTIFVSPSKKKTLIEKYKLFDQVSHVRNTEDSVNEPTSSKNSNRESLQEDKDRKRKAEHDSQLHQVMADIKRRKTGSSEWCSSVLNADLRETEDVPESVSMPSTTTEIFLATLEDGFTFEALQYLATQITFKYYPQSKIISELMRNVLLIADEEILANMSYNILSRMLMLHPPITATLQDVYLRALAGCQEGEEWQVGAEWNFINQCFSNILTSDDVAFTRNNLLLFRFILQLLQQNLKYLSVLQEDCDTRHMLLRIIWSPSYHVVFNKRCRTLVEVMSDLIQTYQAKFCDTEKSLLLEVLDGVLWMVAMVTECCRVLECGNIDKVQALHAASTSAFVHEISRKLIDLDLRDHILLENVLRGLNLPWLRVGVCQHLLNTLDDYLLVEASVQDSKSLSLLLIVTQYIYLLPVFDVLPRTPGVNLPARKRTKQSTQTNSVAVSNCLTENIDMNKENIDKISVKAKKRNPKGETPLHVACMKNDVVAVKKLLKVPGIDVNAADNVGWTPLHEACNHGNIECVRELLKFVPSKTVDIFFNKDSTGCRKVDLMAGNGEGITPLHDAVLSNHLEVCQLLLQHGGSKLLEAQTVLSYTPLDLAETDDMAALLSSYSHVRRKQSNSLNTIGSQDSFCLTEECVPKDALYEQVMYAEGERVYVNIRSAMYYIHLVTLLVKHYITLRSVQLICHCMKNRISQQDVEMLEQESNSCREDTPVSDSCHSDCDSKCGGLSCHSVCDIKCGGLSCQNNENGSRLNKQTSYCCASHTSRRTRPAMEFGRTEQERDDVISRPNEDKEAVADIKKDLKILKNMPFYIKLFKIHLLKICRPDDLPVIENELQELSFVTEALTY